VRSRVPSLARSRRTTTDEDEVDRTPAVVGSDIGTAATKITKMQVRIGEPYDWIDQAPAHQLRVRVKSFHAASSFGSYELKATAEVSSTFTVPIKKAHVELVYYSAAGKIVGGTDDYANFVPASGKAEVSFDFPSTRVKRVEAFVNLDNTYTAAPTASTGSAPIPW
jgi:hypothetical protein